MQHTDAPEERDQDEAVRVAEQVREDLRVLHAILDQQLSNGAAADPEVLSHLAEAISAAQRGVDLSNQLVDLLRTAAD